MEPKSGTERNNNNNKNNPKKMAVIGNGYGCEHAKYTQFTEFAIKHCFIIINTENCKRKMRIWANNNRLLKIRQTIEGKRRKASNKMNDIMVFCVGLQNVKNNSIYLRTMFSHFNEFDLYHISVHTAISHITLIVIIIIFVISERWIPHLLFQSILGTNAFKKLSKSNLLFTFTIRGTWVE